MPDGTIVAQAIQLFSDEEVYEISGQEGDQLLFFMEIEEYTRNLYLDAYFAYDNWEDWESIISMPTLLMTTFQTRGNMMTLEKTTMITCGLIIHGLMRVSCGWSSCLKPTLMT